MSADAEQVLLFIVTLGVSIIWGYRTISGRRPRLLVRCNTEVLDTDADYFIVQVTAVVTNPSRLPHTIEELWLTADGRALGDRVIATSSTGEVVVQFPRRIHEGSLLMSEWQSVVDPNTTMQYIRIIAVPPGIRVLYTHVRMEVGAGTDRTITISTDCVKALCPPDFRTTQVLL